MKYSKNIQRVLLAVFVLGLSFSCTKYDNPPVINEDYEVEVDTSVSRKVLVISIDGLVGQELEKNVPTNIAKLQENAKYSYSGISDEKSNDASTWASMMTGYSYNRHYINDENYLPEGDPNDPHGEVNFVESVLYRIENVKPSVRTSVITRSSGLANTLLMDADNSIHFNSDEEVKEEAVKSFSKEVTPDVTVLQFTSVLDAGKNAGFSIDKEEYASAITKVDGYIGDIFNTIKENENYKYEDWLIVVTSNHGGIGKEYGGSSFSERNIFSLYYHKDIVSQELNAELLTSPRLYGDASGVRGRNESALPEEVNYNFNETGELTIEAVVKVNKNGSGNYQYSWPPFLSKTNARTGTTAGWAFFRSGNNVSFFVADGNEKIEFGGGPVGVDEKWTHITGTIKENDGKVTAKFYINGTKVGEQTEELAADNITSTSPLTFGFQPEVFSSDFIDMQMADVKIWNTALSDDQIRQNSRRLGVPDDHPNLASLVGYWPMNDQDELLRNKVEGMPNIPLHGDYQYKVLANNMDYVDEGAILLTNYEVSSQILYWLEITIQDEWSLDGQVFLSQFELEFLK